MRIIVATALTAVLATTGCSTSRCGCQDCTCSSGPHCATSCVPPAPQPPPRSSIEVPTSPQVSERPQDAVREAQMKGYGYGPEHRWLVGTLHRVHMPGSDWKLRYLPLSEQDQYGGGAVLSIDARIDEFKDGDIVYVEGEVIGDRPTLYLSGPLYRISAIQALPEPSPLASHPKAYQ